MYEYLKPQSCTEDIPFPPTGMLKTIRIFTKQLFYLKGFTLTVTFSVLLAWL
ncbi:hypothetical protein M065_1093 [Bacteroides fragilis str. Korea 419]|nr:hypothetical protein M065_1093 [Bacteroides fragilis str. Korea 419]